jgi:hypothetical protein
MCVVGHALLRIAAESEGLYERTAKGRGEVIRMYP